VFAPFLTHSQPLIRDISIPLGIESFVGRCGQIPDHLHGAVGLDRSGRRLAVQPIRQRLQNSRPERRGPRIFAGEQFAPHFDRIAARKDGPRQGLMIERDLMNTLPWRNSDFTWRLVRAFPLFGVAKR
jgi:hypothetical protein